METIEKNCTVIQRYNWAVWKNCRLIGYVTAYSEWEAVNKARERFGGSFFVERSPVAVESDR